MVSWNSLNCGSTTVLYPSPVALDSMQIRSGFYSLRLERLSLSMASIMNSLIKRFTREQLGGKIFFVSTKLLPTPRQHSYSILPDSSGVYYEGFQQISSNACRQESGFLVSLERRWWSLFSMGDQGEGAWLVIRWMSKILAPLIELRDYDLSLFWISYFLNSLTFRKRGLAEAVLIFRSSRSLVLRIESLRRWLGGRGEGGGFVGWGSGGDSVIEYRLQQ